MRNSGRTEGSRHSPFRFVGGHPPPLPKRRYRRRRHGGKNTGTKGVRPASFPRPPIEWRALLPRCLSDIRHERGSTCRVTWAYWASWLPSPDVTRFRPPRRRGGKLAAQPGVAKKPLRGCGVGARWRSVGLVMGRKRRPAPTLRSDVRTHDQARGKSQTGEYRGPLSSSRMPSASAGRKCRRSAKQTAAARKEPTTTATGVESPSVRRILPWLRLSIGCMKWDNLRDPDFALWHARHEREEKSLLAVCAAGLFRRVTQLRKSLTVARLSGLSRVGEAQRGLPRLRQIVTLDAPLGALSGEILSAELPSAPCKHGSEAKNKKRACSSLAA